jgi:hypothetical protein
MPFGTSMKENKKKFQQLCSPSKLYLIISLVSVILILIQNLFETSKYCVGMYSCKINFPNVFIFIMKLIYIIVWTIILDSLCKNNYMEIAWGLVLLPYILMFVIIGYFMLTKM